MSSVYDRGFRKVTTSDALVEGEPTLFRTGGEILVLLKHAGTCYAADVTRLIDESLPSPAARIASLARAFGAVDLPSWIAAIDRRALPVEIRNGEIWICIDQCAQ